MVEHADQICQALPGASLDAAIGQLMIATLTPLAVEAATAVAAEPGQRAGYAGQLRAAAIERARYHADLTRRRYLAIDPANRLVADTLEADWNTALRALNDAKDAYDTAQNAATANLAEIQKTRIRTLVTDFPAIWNDPATPQRERKRMTRLLLTDVTVTRNAKPSPATCDGRAAKTAPSPCRTLLAYWRIVPAPMRCPRPRSSPWMRRCPQRGFCLASRRTSSRISSGTGGRPVVFGRSICS
jgi:hypothetical protein